jgi:uncharacterized damage-inducible protein DinB
LVPVTETLRALRQELAEARGRVFDAVRGLNEEQFRHVPPGEEWPIAAHLAHLLISDRWHVAFVREALARRPTPPAEDDETETQLAARMAIPQMVHGLLNARRELDRLVEEADDARLAAEVTAPGGGRVSLAALLGMLAGHDIEHAGEIARLARLAPASARVTLPSRQRS